MSLELKPKLTPKSNGKFKLEVEMTATELKRLAQVLGHIEIGYHEAELALHFHKKLFQAMKNEHIK